MPNAVSTAHHNRPATTGRRAASLVRSARSEGSNSRPPMAANGASPPKTQRQDSCSVSQPATTGPTRPGTTQEVASAAKIRGRTWSG